LITLGKEQSIFKFNAKNADKLVAIKAGGENYINYTNAFKVAEDRYCFICGRARFRSDNDYDENCIILDENGKRVCEFCVGDGVEAAQTNKNGEIWVSYFDEGIYGNYGWLSQNSVGKNGLNCFDVSGKIIYAYDNSAFDIDDCYALNVANKNETWIYYYSAFNLALIKDKKIERVIKMPIEGSESLAIEKSKLLIDGGYDKRDKFALFDMKEGLKKLGSYRFYDEDDNVLYCCCAQKNSLYFWERDKLYKIGIDELIETI
jgi:hypothetical protein